MLSNNVTREFPGHYINKLAYMEVKYYFKKYYKKGGFRSKPPFKSRDLTRRAF